MLRALPWFLILLAIAIVQVVRGQVFDVVLFGLGAVAIAADALGVLPEPRRVPSIPGSVLIAGAGVLAVLLILSPRHGLAEGAAVAAVGLVALPLAWLPRARRTTASESHGPDDEAAVRRIRIRRAAIAWSVVVVAMCLVELTSFILGRMPMGADGEYPAISDLLDPLLDGWPGRLCFIVGWLALGGLLLRMWRRRDA